MNLPPPPPPKVVPSVKLVFVEYGWDTEYDTQTVHAWTNNQEIEHFPDKFGQLLWLYIRIKVSTIIYLMLLVNKARIQSEYYYKLAIYSV